MRPKISLGRQCGKYSSETLLNSGKSLSEIGWTVVISDVHECGLCCLGGFKQLVDVWHVYVCVHAHTWTFCAVVPDSVQLGTISSSSWMKSCIIKHDILLRSGYSIIYQLHWNKFSFSKQDTILACLEFGFGIYKCYFCSETSEDFDTSDWSNCKPWKRNLLEVWNLWTHTRKMD